MSEFTTDTLAIGDRDGLVVLQFQKPVQWVTLDEETARRVGEQLLRQAYKVRFGDYPTPAKTMLTDAMRVKARQRATLMLRSMANEAPVPDHNVQANRLVDEILKVLT